jgi:hypothetical protein
MQLQLFNLIFRADTNTLDMYCTLISAADVCVYQEDLRKKWSVLGVFLCPRAVNMGTAGCSPRPLTRSQQFLMILEAI